jgi:hypothetical protein
LNQYQLIENTQRLPKIAFWLSVAVFVFLFINYWQVLSFLNKWKYYPQIENAFAGFAFATSIWIPLILFYFTFSLNEATTKVIEQYVVYLLIAVIILGLLLNSKRIINWFKGLKVEEEAK